MSVIPPQQNTTTKEQFTCPENAAAIENAEVAAATQGLADFFGRWMHNRVVAHYAPAAPRLRFEVRTGHHMFVLWATDRKGKANRKEIGRKTAKARWAKHRAALAQK